jgi:hypothetical protein
MMILLGANVDVSAEDDHRPPDQALAHVVAAVALERQRDARAGTPKLWPA